MKTITTTISILALIFFSFAAQAQSNSCRITSMKVEISMEDGLLNINWSTAKEVNSSYFLLEKSNDSIHFTAMKMINAAGISNFSRQYNYSETADSNEIAYYRISLVSMNGEQMRSEVVNNAELLQIMPLAVK